MQNLIYWYNLKFSGGSKNKLHKKLNAIIFYQAVEPPKPYLGPPLMIYDVIENIEKIK